MFPCSHGANMSVDNNDKLICVFKESTSSEPMRVMISGFTYSANTATTLNLVIQNPTVG